jgi:hypothetical protein
MRSVLAALATLSLVPCLGGCSLFASSMQSVAITASDPNAYIFVDGEPVGKGSAAVNLKRNNSHAVMAKVGDRAGSATIGTCISTTGVLDIIGGVFLLVPFIGLAGPGFWSLDPTTVHVVLPPAAAPVVPPAH